MSLFRYVALSILTPVDSLRLSAGHQLICKSYFTSEWLPRNIQRKAFPETRSVWQIGEVVLNLHIALKLSLLLCFSPIQLPLRPTRTIYMYTGHTYYFTNPSSTEARVTLIV